MFVRSLLALLALSSLAPAQTEIYKPYKNIAMWSADTLYVGASFIRLGGAPIMVSLKGNEAGFTGRLYVINPFPVGRPRPDTLALFTNHDPVGTTVNITALTNVPIPGEVVFMYIVENNNFWGPFDPVIDKLPKFSGPNLGGSKYRSEATSENHPNPNLQFGRCWSVVGKIPAGGGDLEFGFEDMANLQSDMDFDDVIFRVSGLSLGIYNRDLDRRSLVW